MNIYIENETSSVFGGALKTIIEKAIIATLKLEMCPYEVDVNVSIVDAFAIKEINLKTRGIDTETDVLSFPLIAFMEACDFETIELEDDAFNMDNGDLYLGDILICYDKAKEQALEYAHSIEREIAFLTVHSMLHLLGYDHIEIHEEEEMRAHQNDILNEMGLKR